MPSMTKRENAAVVGMESVRRLRSHGGGSDPTAPLRPTGEQEWALPANGDYRRVLKRPMQVAVYVRLVGNRTFVSGCVRQVVHWDVERAAKLLKADLEWRAKTRPWALRPSHMPSACRQQAWQ
eukprot:712178-Pleurochrysis_carterae.AAC.1